MIATTLLLAAQAMTFTADQIAADNITRALAATGHIVAVSAPITLRGESMERTADGTYFFRDPTCVTTCTNAVGHTHWNVTGEVEYKTDDYVILRNMQLRFMEVPILWLPYLHYPLLPETGFTWMPGYCGKWGGYLLTRYHYHLLGDRMHEDAKYWLRGGTRLDLRYKQGVAGGEDLKWSLGDYGTGRLGVYYAYDSSDKIKSHDNDWYGENWGSLISRNRYGVDLWHSLEPTERDRVFVQGSYYSDSSFRWDFYRKSLFNSKSQYTGYNNSGIFWEHVEAPLAVGAEVSGPLNEFYAMTGRLPELYLDVNPQPLFGLPVNYESENRIGYLTRDYGKYGEGRITNPFARQPGRWAEYETFRLDTYHRLTMPFRAFDDVLSTVPRVGYHGTYWNQSGRDNLTGRGKATDEGDLFRSVFEGGVTFAARGTGWVNETWRHVAEPYFDVLLQEASFSDSHNRPYVFDSIDASSMWEDQFAGRARNLPYSYYGVTPGMRNVWQKADQSGRLVDVLDLDAYVAVQFNDTTYRGLDGAHRLAKVGEPNYGRSECLVVPGARVRYNPTSDISLMARVEYDTDDDKVPVADAGFRQKVSDTFNWYADWGVRDYRIWDFSSTPATLPGQLGESEKLNFARFHYVEVGFEHQPLDWFAWGPFMRWDLREGELDSIGTWFDYLTDCLGFRFMVEYENSYMRIDGYEHDDDWSFGFYIYLRAFGAGSTIFR